MSGDTEDFLFITGEMASHLFIPGEESDLQVEGKYYPLKAIDDWNFWWNVITEVRITLSKQLSWEILKLHRNLLISPTAPLLETATCS